VTKPIQPLLENSFDKKSILVSCGGRHTLALMSDNSVFGWGNNKFG